MSSRLTDVKYDDEKSSPGLSFGGGTPDYRPRSKRALSAPTGVATDLDSSFGEGFESFDVYGPNDSVPSVALMKENSAILDEEGLASYSCVWFSFITVVCVFIRMRVFVSLIP